MTTDYVSERRSNQFNITDIRMHQWCQLQEHNTQLIEPKQAQIYIYQQAQYDMAQQHMRYNSRYSRAFLLNAAAPTKPHS
jgi:hypothetical protein